MSTFGHSTVDAIDWAELHAKIRQQLTDKGLIVEYKPEWHASPVQQSKMLSTRGPAAFEVWRKSGRIDGAIDTEDGPIAFVEGKICGHESQDIQSGRLARWEPALKDATNVICSVSRSEEPTVAFETLGKIWLQMEHTTGLVESQVREVWSDMGREDRVAALEHVPTTLRARLALQVIEPTSAEVLAISDTESGAYPWLEEAQRLEADGQGEESLDIIFDHLDDWLLGGEFNQCSSFLSNICLDEHSTAQLLTILTATLAARNKLCERPGFYKRVHLELQQRGEDANALLLGLDG